MVKFIGVILSLLIPVVTPAVGAAGQCQSERVSPQVLGSRGPELWDGQASTGYLLWLDGKARMVVDAGPAYVKGGFFSDRERDLPVYGPSGNEYLPSAAQFVQRLFGREPARCPFPGTWKFSVHESRETTGGRDHLLDSCTSWQDRFHA